MLRLAVVLIPFALIFFQGKPSSLITTKPGKLLEAVEFSACDYHCAPFNRPTVAYCIQAGPETLVGERASILGVDSAKSLLPHVGQELTFKADSSSIWLMAPGDRVLKIKRGSLFERFKDTRCVAAVHKPILDAASSDVHSNQIPANAFAIAADRETAPFYWWFQCAVNPEDSDIVCKKWDSKGVSRGVDRYCPRTREGTSVDANFEIDRLLSRDGRLVLHGGQVLLHDDRGRVNDRLMSPAEICKQMTPLD